MAREKVNEKEFRAALVGVKALIKQHGIATVNRAWNYYYKASKERDRLMKQKAETDRNLHELNRKLTQQIQKAEAKIQ